MATFDVPESRSVPRVSSVQIGKAVSASSPLIQTAQLIHWVRGRGYALIPTQFCDVQLTSGSEVFRYRVEPSGRAIARVWIVGLRSEGFGVVNIKPNAATARAVSPLFYRYRGARYSAFVYLEDLAAKSGAEQELTFTIEHVSGTRTYVDSLGCWELPRAALTADGAGSAVDLGIDLRSLEPGRPIYESLTEGLYALANTVHATQTRRHLLQNWVSTCSFNSGTEQLLFKPAPVITPTKLGRADTVRNIRTYIYCRVTAADTQATVRYFTSDAADSSSFLLDGSISTAFSWQLGPDDIQASCEDFTDPAGLPGGSFETFQVGITRDAGTGNVEIKGVSVYEHAA